MNQILKLNLKNETIKLSENRSLNFAEILCQIGGIFCPVISIFGTQFGIINKKIASDNLKLLSKSIDKLNCKINEIGIITQNMIKNLTLNVQDIIEKTIKEKSEQRIKAYANLLIKAINDKNIFESDNKFNEMADIIMNLSFEEFKFLFELNNKTNYSNGVTPYIFDVSYFYVDDFDKSKIDDWFLEKNTGNLMTLGNADLLPHLISLGLIDKKDILNKENNEILAQYKLSLRFFDFWSFIGNDIKDLFGKEIKRDFIK